MNRLVWLAIAGAAHWPAWWWVASTARYGGDAQLQSLAALAALASIARGFARAPAERAVDLRAPAVALLLSSALAPLQGPLVGAVCAVLSTTWIAARCGGTRRFPLATAGLGLLALPLLPVFELIVGPALRVPVASAAAGLLSSIGLPVRAIGTVLTHPGGEVWVDPPCAGLGMVWTAAFVAFAASATTGRAPLRTLATLAVALLAAALGNVWRVASLFVLETSTRELPAWLHSGAGLVIEAAVIGVVLVHATPRRREEGLPCSATVVS